MVTMSGANCDDGKSVQAKFARDEERQRLGFRTIQVRLKTGSRRMGILHAAKLPLRAPGAVVAGGTRLS